MNRRPVTVRLEASLEALARMGGVALETAV
jgi:hypothetical protein